MTPDGFAHGGDLASVGAAFGVSPESLLDFSANVNPMGLPPRAAQRLQRDACEPRCWSQYPDPKATELVSVLSEQLQTSADCIVVGAGADALIHAGLRALAPRRCLVPVPAFSEYARACHACRIAVRTVPLGPSFSLEHAAIPNTGPEDLVILNNPHNPTGALASRDAMRAWIDTLALSGASILADEAFIDYAPEAAITRDASSHNGVVAVRSLTKFFGCAGLRIGYAVASPETARAVRAQLASWPVSTLAVNTLAEALRDPAYAEQTIALNASARACLAEQLRLCGCAVAPSAANFLFLRLPPECVAAQVRARLIRDHRIVVRECDSFEGIEPGRYLRVAVRDDKDNHRLTQALTSVLGESSCRTPS